jgi:DNA-binding response OmpR family regulator
MVTRMTDRDRPLVLVADDDADILELVAFRLEKAGYEVVKASDGEEALRVATEVRPDLAVLDAGADDYLKKPFSPQELRARVQAILGRR